MISEINFAKGYSAFWTANAPNLGDYTSSALSVGKRIGKAISLPEDPHHVAVNNLIATTHFRNISARPECTVEESMDASIPIINVFYSSWKDRYDLTENYRKIITIQAERLGAMYVGKLVHDPPFPGCGIMTNCNGDLLSGTTLIEIKAHRDTRKKPFRLEDFRQLLVYLALNYIAGSIYDIRKIHLFNPRMGYLWQSGVEEFIYLVSNTTSESFFKSMGTFLSELSESPDFLTGFEDFDN